MAGGGQDCPSHDALAAALDALDEAASSCPRGAGDVQGPHGADRGVRAGHRATDPPEATVRYVVLGTMLPEPLLLALRRLAQQAASARRFGS